MEGEKRMTKPYVQQTTTPVEAPSGNVNPKKRKIPMTHAMEKGNHRMTREKIMNQSIMKPEKKIQKSKESFKSKALKGLDKATNVGLSLGAKGYSLAKNSPAKILAYEGSGKLLGNPKSHTGEGGKAKQFRSTEELNKLGYKGGDIPEDEKPQYHKNKLVSTARTIRSGIGLLSDVTNPFNIARVAKDAALGRGVVLPGSSYIGPGNEMESKGKLAKNDTDAAAYQHDVDYTNYLNKDKKSAKDVYAGFSAADQRLMNRANLETKEGIAAYLGMGVKKLGANLGITKKHADLNKNPQSKSKRPNPLLPKNNTNLRSYSTMKRKR